jgi:hypothetical protein
MQEEFSFNCLQALGRLRVEGLIIIPNTKEGRKWANAAARGWAGAKPSVDLEKALMPPPDGASQR